MAKTGKTGNGKALRNLGGGQPSAEELKKYRFLIARDAATAQGKDEGNFSKAIKDNKVHAEEMQLYVKVMEGQNKDRAVFYPLGTKTIQAVDMSQFEELPAEAQKQPVDARTAPGTGKGKGGKKKSVKGA